MVDLILLPPIVGWTTGRFGQSDDGWTPENPHRGYDISGPEGTKIMAPCDGRVVDFTNYGDFGPHAVCIDYDGKGNWFVLLAHCSKSYVSIGQWVTMGQAIAEVGHEGKAYGDHVHIQVCKNTLFSTNLSDSIDPEPLFITEDEMERLSRIERIVAGYGMTVVPWANDPSIGKEYWVEHLFPAGTAFVAADDPRPYDKMVTITGDNALEYCDRRGWSLGMGLGQARENIRRHYDAHANAGTAIE